MTVREWMEKNKGLSREDAVSRCVKELKVGRKTAYKMYAKVVAGGKVNAHNGRSLADFRAAHDKSFIVPTAIKRALSTMVGDWLYEIEFAKSAGVTLADIGMFRDQFAEKHVLSLKDRRVWVRTEALKRQMQEMV